MLALFKEIATNAVEVIQASGHVQKCLQKLIASELATLFLDLFDGHRSIFRIGNV